MRARRVTTAGLCCALLVGPACSDPPSSDGVGAPIAPLPQPRRELPPPSLYDADGVPRESGERVAGLMLPVGLTEVAEAGSARRHVYTSEIPADRLLRYFGPRLTTLEIERRGEAVIYREAVPHGVRGGVVKLDVTIQPASAHPARVEIVEVPPPPPNGVTVSEDEIRRHLESLTKNRE